MARQADWAKLHHNWHRDQKITGLLRDYGPAAGAYWAYLVAHAHAASHYKRNPEGSIIGTSIASIAHDLHDRHERIELWSAMVRRGLVRITGGDWKTDTETEITITLTSFAKNQWPMGSRQIRRYDEKANVEHLQGNVLQVSASVQNCPPDKDRDRDRDRDKPPTPSAHTGAPIHTHTREDSAVTQAVEAVATHLNEDAGIWHDRIGMWWSANQHTTSGDLVAALIAITVAPQKVKNPWQYFQRIVKRENGETRKIEKDVAVAAQKHDESVKPARGWREDWAERLAIIEAKERGEA